jgi:predicted transcriptional regulator
MSKAVLISIRPKWCEKIISGEKTIEVRKTRPKMDTPFKCYIYCTQSADMLWILKERERSLHPDKIADVFKAAKCGGVYRGNGKIIGEFVCDDIFERIVRVGAICDPPKYCICDWNMDCTPLDTLLADACMTKDELEKYLDGGVGYGLHISDLRVYDHPRDLWEFTGLRQTKYGLAPVPITRPPQSWRYVEGLL